VQHLLALTSALVTLLVVSLLLPLLLASLLPLLDVLLLMAAQLAQLPERCQAAVLYVTTPLRFTPG
jgi:hypothetical protein